MSDTIKRHIRKAKAVLERNWTGSFTMPSNSLYPHQWNWDSAFIAIGYSHFNTDRAVVELTRLFNGQWKNGMVPQIVFDRDRLGTYFPEPDTWRTDLASAGPEGALTSGITMPPIHAYAVLKVYENARRPGDLKDFLKWIYPRLMASHRFLYDERDPDGTGLAYIRHPWESGMDNSPMWDIVMKRMAPGSFEVPAYERRDLSSGVKSEMRPGKEDYDRFIFLVELFKKLEYDEKKIRQECPFLVYGPLFNSILCASNEALVKISDIVGEPSAEPEQWYETTRSAIEKKLYHEEHGIFDYFDMVSGELLEVDSAAGFMPLFCGAASPPQADKLYNYLNSRSFCALHQGNCFSIPNYNFEKEGFDRKNYWRGPVWININWLILQGLKRYGYLQKADSVAKDILELPVRFGFREYYDSLDGMGLGSKDFSWTAALFIDTAFETYLKAPEASAYARLRNVLWRPIVLNSEKPDEDVDIEHLPQTMLSTIKDIKAKYYTDTGRVDYDSIRASLEYRSYRKISARLADYDLSSLDDEREKLAFWINLYNTIVVDAVIWLGVRGSVREYPGFFSKLKYCIGKHLFSADDIEHGILRANSRHPFHAFRQFPPLDPRKALGVSRTDPRIHFALVCGSRSCAPIKFYTPGGIYEELELATVNFVNSSEVIVVPEENRIILSKIFLWYKPDMGGARGVLEFISRYLVDAYKKEFLKKNINTVKIEYLYYDWHLNK